MLSQLFMMNWLDLALAVVDIALISYVFYRLFMLIRGTRAVQLVKGILVFLAATAVARRLNLETTYYLLRQVQLGLIVALPVVFQPELRRALEQIGRGRLFRASPFFSEERRFAEVIDEIVGAVERLARNKIGALIVIERETGLGDVVETGIEINGNVSAEFLVNLFIPATPLHDGAVIIRNDKVLAAACFLPLSDAPDLGPEVGGRHRAALGITEESDAVSVVVSEETGQVSLANEGKLLRNLDIETLEEMLDDLLSEEDAASQFLFWQRGSSDG